MAIEEAPPAVDATELGRFVDDWLEPIYGYVARRVPDRESAEDVTTRTFERAAQELRRGALAIDDVPGFLLRVASSAVVDHARRLRKQIPPDLRASDLDDEGDAEAAAWLADSMASRAFAAAVDGNALRRAALRLDDDDLRIVLLRYLDGLDNDAIAAVLATTREAAAVRVHRALGALVEALPEPRAHVA
ncbi:MAG TPA: sigma-70 family RNA polymerase sigma factor [Candidatus Limnocylindrales bacterium]|nr:sigma-70 family RNA polymerase sigma factor [Candidatus Limnocylindrales bacterium]